MTDMETISVGDSKKKKRDSRSHIEKIQELRQVFERLKIRAEVTGRVNECTLEKVRKAVGVGDAYFYSHKLKDPEMNKRYHDIRDDIARFRSEFNENKTEILEASELMIAIAEKEAMEKERDGAQAKVARLNKRNIDLDTDLSFYKEKAAQVAKQYENNAVNIAYAQVTNKSKSSNVVSFTQPKIISPDLHLVTNGKYDYTSESKIDAAWRSASHELEMAVKSINIPIRLYLLIGVQCSGKTTWHSNISNFYTDRQPVVIDTTNLTPGSRAQWFVLLSEIRAEVKKDVKVCGVYFDVPVALLMQRNGMRPPDRRLPDDVLKSKFEELVPPSTKERFDEIIIVRHK